jgi:hypothetical protein
MKALARQLQARNTLGRSLNAADARTPGETPAFTLRREKTVGEGPRKWTLYLAEDSSVGHELVDSLIGDILIEALSPGTPMHAHLNISVNTSVAKKEIATTGESTDDAKLKVFLGAFEASRHTFQFYSEKCSDDAARMHSCWSSWTAEIVRGFKTEDNPGSEIADWNGLLNKSLPWKDKKEAPQSYLEKRWLGCFKNVEGDHGAIVKAVWTLFGIRQKAYAAQDRTSLINQIVTTRKIKAEAFRAKLIKYVTVTTTTGSGKKRSEEKKKVEDIVDSVHKCLYASNQEKTLANAACGVPYGQLQSIAVGWFKNLTSQQQNEVMRKDEIITASIVSHRGCAVEMHRLASGRLGRRKELIKAKKLVEQSKTEAKAGVFSAENLSKACRKWHKAAEGDSERNALMALTMNPSWFVPWGETLAALNWGDGSNLLNYDGEIIVIGGREPLRSFQLDARKVAMTEKRLTAFKAAWVKATQEFEAQINPGVDRALRRAKPTRPVFDGLMALAKNTSQVFENPDISFLDKDYWMWSYGDMDGEDAPSDDGG